MKIVFVDVDGVLNWRGTEERVGRYLGLCPKRIARLNMIFDGHPDAKIILSSTWRKINENSTLAADGYTSFAELLELFKSLGIRGEIIGHTPIYWNDRPRGDEIRGWLEQNEGKWSEFVVLDDDDDRFEEATYHRYGEAPQTAMELRDRHVLTYSIGDPDVPGEEGGLQDRHVEQAIRVLNGERLPLIKRKGPRSLWDF